MIISHRGNLAGPNPEKENHPDYIAVSLNDGFHVEIDAWIIKNKVYLGHDAPVYEATDYFRYHGAWYQYNGNFVDSPALWIHCKNFSALNEGSSFFYGHYFTHNQDDFTLTSTGYIWTYPRNLPLSKISIAVMPERVPEWNVSLAAGVCTDFPIKYK